MQSKYQRPYQLSLWKQEVLCHELDEVLKQGVIIPFSEKEDQTHWSSFLK